jgi:putative FmdB family regulatory protein
MPLYEYVCSACGAAFEQLIRAQREERDLHCPQCGSQRIERQFSVIATPQVKNAPPARSGPCSSCCQPDGACPYQ